uniref:DNA 3'-5' helicase n=1 Tax=Amphimedon queenslandica TaxID=400682 RepID=A0A1X7UDJ2_AMPQE
MVIMDSLTAAIEESASLLGFSSLKEQAQCFREFMKGRDVFAILLTGYKKTLCFTCLPVAFDLYHRRSGDKRAIIMTLLECDLLTCFFKGTDSDVKSTIIDNFTKQPCLRIVICTDPFGMGIDFKNVIYKIYYGVPNDMETYVPQIGRGRREGIDSYVVMLHSKRLLDNCEGKMLDYVKNKSQCRRDMLLSEFENYVHFDEKKGCRCCDICTKKCQCNNFSHITHIITCL